MTAKNDNRHPDPNPSAAPAVGYSYLRFSSPKQADGDSMRRQTDLRDAWLKRHPHVHLDTSLVLQDKGVSGYKGDHRKKNKHALAQFIDLVERGRVPVGSYLIVENLDRLTREDPEDSIPLVMGLIRAGVKVVQLVPSEMVYERGMDFGKQIMMLWELARGHGESKRKSGLCGAAWVSKKGDAATMLTPYGAMCPGWLELVGVKLGSGNRKDYSEAKYVIRKGAGEILRSIFQWCADGMGTFAILEKLNHDGIPSFGRTGLWDRSYLKKLLSNRAVLGEYQPHKGSRGSSRKEEGEPIPGYYPAVIEETLWHQAQAAMQSRRRVGSGRPATISNNPFAGLLKDALDGENLHVSGTNGPKYRYLVSNGALQKRKDAKWRTFSLDVFTSALLSQLVELKASALFQDPVAEKLTVLNGKLSEVEKRLAVAVAKFEADPDSPTWADKVDQYDREKRVIVQELSEAKMEAAHPITAIWTEAVTLMAENEPQRLRAALMQTIDGIWCVFSRRGKVALAEVQVWFSGGQPYQPSADPETLLPSGTWRSYTIMHRVATANAKGRRGARYCVTSSIQPEAARQGIPGHDDDLHVRHEAEKVAESLEKLPQWYIDKMLDKLGQDIV